MPTSLVPALSSEHLEPLLLNKAKLAARYNVGVRTVDYWVATELIPVVKIGKLNRFYTPDCDKIIMANRRPARSEKKARKIKIKRAIR